jgi:hypothetical protein
LDPVADDRVAHRFGYDKAGARRRGERRLVDKQVDDQGPTAGSTATADRCGEVRTTPQSLRRGKHDYLGIPTGLAVGSGRQLAAALGPTS